MSKQYSINQVLVTIFSRKITRFFLSFLDYFYSTNDRKKTKMLDPIKKIFPSFSNELATEMVLQKKLRWNI